MATEEALPGDPAAFCMPGGAFERRTYYACARLRALPHLLALYQAPILVTDMDVGLSAPPDPIWQALGTADCGLIRFPAQSQPLWQEFFLALAAFRPSASGRRFAAMLAAYVEHFLERREWVWSLDQAALYSAAAEAERTLTGWRYAVLSPALIASSDRPSASAVFRHHVASQS